MSKKFFAAVVAIEGLAYTALTGTMAGLGILVAPVLFKTVTSRDLAGRTFGAILNNWFWVGLVSTLLLVAGAAFTLATVKSMRKLLLARLLILAPMLALILWFGGVMSRLTEIQNSLTKPIEEYAADVNPRLEFDQLHKLSTQLMSVDLFIGLVWFVLSVWTLTAFLGRAKATETSVVEPSSASAKEPVLR